jgi:hypothetical protein
MSIQLIQQYYNNVDQLIRYGGTRNEMSLRKAFKELLDHYARSKNLLLVPEVGVPGRRGRTVHPDGTLKDALRQDWSYWESRDERDTLEEDRLPGASQEKTEVPEGPKGRQGTQRPPAAAHGRCSYVRPHYDGQPGKESLLREEGQAQKAERLSAGIRQLLRDPEGRGEINRKTP